MPDLRLRVVDVLWGTPKTPIEIRMHAPALDRCVAFTYIKKKRKCWLKGAVGTPLFKSSMISRVTSFQTFAPAKVVGLD